MYQSGIHWVCQHVCVVFYFYDCTTNRRRCTAHSLIWTCTSIIYNIPSITIINTWNDGTHTEFTHDSFTCYLCSWNFIGLLQLRNDECKLLTFDCTTPRKYLVLSSFKKGQGCQSGGNYKTTLEQIDLDLII
jgi:hypothetical protein